jgi:hypothetical protein
VSKRIDVEAIPATLGSGYPAPFDLPCRGRARRRIGDVAGLTQFGVNVTRILPGAWSSQRHWHTAEDEFVYVLEGELVPATATGITCRTARTGTRSCSRSARAGPRTTQRSTRTSTCGCSSAGATPTATEHPIRRGNEA